MDNLFQEHSFQQTLLTDDEEPVIPNSTNEQGQVELSILSHLQPDSMQTRDHDDDIENIRDKSHDGNNDTGDGDGTNTHNPFLTRGASTMHHDSTSVRGSRAWYNLASGVTAAAFAGTERVRQFGGAAYQEIADADSSDLFGGGHGEDDREDGPLLSDWGDPSVRNLDTFFERLYRYYYEQGFSSMLLKRAMHLVTLGFTIVFSTFLIGFVHWNELAGCRDEETCHKNFSDYVGLDPAEESVKAFFAATYLLVFSMYWLWCAISVVPTMRAAWKMGAFYETHLRITTRELGTMEWDAVVNRVVHLHESGRRRILLNNSKLDALNITMRIMRRDNLFLALINLKILPLGSRFSGEEWYLGVHLERSLYWSIFLRMFDEREFTLRKKIAGDPSVLRRRLRLAGIAHLAFMPFSLGFVTVSFLFKNAQEFHSKQNYLGPRWWSPHALWEFRELNELPHAFDRRLYASLPHAEEYVTQFSYPIPTAIASAVSFIAGGVLGVLLIFTFIDESILLHVKLGERNLFWYFAIFSAVLTLARAMVPHEKDLVFAPNAAMRKLVAYTHFLPDTWRGRCHTYDVRDAFCALFQYKVVLFLRELVCIFTTPFVLIFVLPRYADEVLEFIRTYSAQQDGVGDVCVFSMFKLREHGDHKYGAPRLQRRAEAPGLAMNGGKLEKSWLNFRAQNPSWGGAMELYSGGPDLLQRLAAFQRQTVDEAAAATVHSSDTRGTGGLLQSGGPGSEMAHERGEGGRVDVGHMQDMSRSAISSASSAGLAGSLILQSPELHPSRMLSGGGGGAVGAGPSISVHNHIQRRSDTFQQQTSGRGPSVAALSSASVPKMQHGMFHNEESVTLPMQAVHFPNAENYFYWLEELRDKVKR